VDILFKGRLLPDIITIPRSAMRENKSVWVMSDERRLTIRPVKVARLEKQDALISGGLEDGEKVVLTNLSGVADGLKLRVAREGVDK
jgi:hypothetical protein